MHIMLPSFLTLLIVILISRLVGIGFRKIGQPAVMSRIFFPQFTEIFFQPHATTLLKQVAEIGISM